MQLEEVDPMTTFYRDDPRLIAMVWIAQGEECAVCGRTDVDLADQHIPYLPLDLTPDIDLVEARVWCGVCIDFAMRFNDYDWDESQ